MAAGGWVPFKELSHVIRWALSHPEREAYFSLEEALKKHRPDFTNLLENPAKNLSHRQRVQKAPQSGLAIPGLSGSPTLPEDFVEEALLLSDILQLNEISSVELLLAGEQHMPRFPGLTRGLVAVLLYHDGRHCLLSSLRSLLQAREGVAWTLGLPPATDQLVTSFTDQLISDGLVTRILSLLDSLSVKGELAALEKGRAVGPAHHRRQIEELVRDQRACLADCLFVWAVQTPPGKDHTLQIIKHLKKVKVDSGKSVVAAGSDSGGQSLPDITKVTVDMVTVSLCMTVMSCFNIGEESGDQSDESSLGDQYPLLTDATFLPSVHAELTSGDEWGCGWLCAVVKLAWAVLLRECSSHNAFAGVEEVQDDEGLLDEAVRGGVFAFLRRCVQTPNFHEEEYYLKKLHWLLTSMIINMPLKMRELRNYGDEVAREITSRGGVEGSLSQERFFEDLMKLLGDVYRDDPHDLSLEFWWTGADTPRTNQRGISLHKFLGLCTDLLPAPVFTSLLYLLRGLSSSAKTAYHCFEFLKSNSPSLGGGGASAAISLDHFFTSLRQYYLGLRREGAGLATPTGCAISPQELEGLVSVLKLIQTITRLDAGARVVMYESQQWLPVPSLFGLVGCPIPRELKAEILLTLAAFAKSPDIATSMIHTLESVQVLNTVSSVGVAVGGALVQPQAKEGSIQVELEEIESQMEDYRLTRAFLVLLDSVTDVPLLPTLGAAHRVPGFQPYLDFVRDSVLLRFDSRGYQNSSEKWQVARLALEILKKLLTKHEISLDDFGNTSHDLGGGVSSLPISPGHSLLVHMFNDSHLLKKVLMIIDECSRILATPGEGGGVREGERESVAGAALLALQMVESALEKQDSFFSLMRQNNLSVMVTPLDQLLLGINPRSGLADHFINIASYMSLTWETPELALSAVNILISSSHSVKVAKEMAVAISNNKKAKSNIIHGFVEHLEWEGPDTPSDDPAESPTATVAGVHRDVQLGILRLLSDCVGKPPNIAHLLLGFEARRGKQISETTLQDPGVLESPRTVLHSLLSLVQHSSDPRNPIGCHYGNPKLTELCYKVIFQLCSHRDLSTPTLRYLRNNHDFFHAQLSAIPLDVARLRPAEDEEEEGEGEMGGVRIMTSQQVSLLHQQAWLLKAVAIEMRVTAETQLRSHNQRLVDLLMSEKSTNWNPVLGHVTGSVMSELTEYQPELSIANEGQRKILVLLDLVTFEDLPLPPLQAEFEAAIQSCDTEDPSSGLTYTDVRQLHQMMMTEVNSLRGGVGASAQRHSLLQEVQSALEVVVLRNSVLENRHGNTHLFRGWRQVVEISLHSLLGGGGSNEGRGGAEKKEREISVLFELIQGLLARVEGRGRGALSGEVFRVLLVLMSHLSFITTTAVTEDDDSLLTLIFSAPLQSILRDLLTAVQQTPGAMQLARAHLYGALLYFLTVSRQQHSSDSSNHRGQTGLRLEWSEDSLAAGNLATIASFGEPLMEIVCRDASSGHDVTRMLSLSLLDAMFSIDRDGSWLRFIVSRGYLAKLAASLLWEDEALQKMLHPLPDTLRALYVHESRMALLSRLAQTPAGSRELLAANCISYIAQCRFIDLRPDHHNKHTSGLHGNVFDPSGTGFVPSVGDRYRQLLLPLLKLLLTMLTCPGAQRSEVKSQVTSLIGAHSDTFTSILKSHRGPVSVATLEELSLVTGVIGHSGVGQDWSTQDSTALGSGMVHIQRLMLALISHYCNSQMWSGLVAEALRGEAEGTDVNPDPLVTLETKLKVLQICANIVDYCRVAMTMGGKEFSSPYCRIIFSPELMTSLSTNQSRDGPRAFHTSSSSSPLTPSQSQSLGHLIKQLREVSDGYQVTLESSRQIQRKISQPSSLSQDEVLQLVSLAASSLPLSHQQSLARRKLKKMLSLTKKEMDLHAYITENLLYVLWRHLQFYLMHCKPVGGARGMGVGGASFTRPTMRRIDEPAKVTAMETTFDLSSLSEGVSPGDLESLKMSIGRCLPSSLFQQLLDVEEGQEAGRRGQVSFIQALVHRIRKLVKLRAAPPTATPALVT